MRLALPLILALGAWPAPARAASDEAPPRFEVHGSLTATILSSRHPFFQGPTFFDDHVYNWLEPVVKLGSTWNATSAIALTAGATGAATLDTDYYLRDDDLLVVLDPLRLDITLTAASFTVGRQNVAIGDGFLVGDGYNDDAAARYSIPLKYWDGLTARAKWREWSALALAANLSGSYGRRTNSLDEDPVRTQGRVYAGDLAWRERFGVTYFARVDEGVTDQDLQFVSGRGSASLGPFELAGEFAHQGGSVRGNPTDALGFHADLAWHVGPEASVRAMYARFSGDDPSTPAYEGFLDLHYGGGDWNRWYLGNNVGATLLFNENERAYSLEGEFQPAPAWQARLILERFELDRARPLGSGERYYATESDFMLEFDAGGGWSFWLLASGTVPGPAARPVFPNDRITTETILSATYEF